MEALSLAGEHWTSLIPELRAYRGSKIVEVKPMWANKGAVYPDNCIHQCI
jgi:trehalose-6-phosphatase